MTGMWTVPSSAALVRCGQREAAALAGMLAATEPGQSVHGARRRIKQLRSLLRLLREVLGEETCMAANAALREAAAALAGHRRAEALVAAAGKLEAGQERSSFWREVAEAHRTAHAAEGDSGQALATARQAIERAAAAFGSATLAPAGDEAVMHALLSTYGKAGRFLRRGFASEDAETLHEARKFVIHHLHHLSLAEGMDERRILDIGHLREALGDLNDLDELEQVSSAAEVGSSDARRLRKARRRLLSRARRMAGSLFRQKPKRFGKRFRHAVDPHSPDGLHGLQVRE